MKQLVKGLIGPAGVQKLQKLAGRKPKKAKWRNWEIEHPIPKESVDEAISGFVDKQITTNNLNILLCAQPKSGSLHITEVVSRTFDVSNFQVGFNKGSGQAYYPRMIAAKHFHGDTISHCHENAENRILKLVSNLDFKVIVLTRRLTDSLISRKNMLVQDQWCNQMLSESAMAQFLADSPEKQMDTIIELFGSWMINFYSGWKTARDRSPVEPTFITYDELKSDELALLKKIATAVGMPYSEEKAMKEIAFLKNKGGINVTSKRHDAYTLTEKQIDQLRTKAKMFGCTDEDFLGFPI